MQRINHTVSHTIELGYCSIWILIRNNQDCSNKWSDNTKIIVTIYKGSNNLDTDIVGKLIFNDYLSFKKYKDKSDILDMIKLLTK